MLTVHCPRHGTRVLLSERRIRALHNTENGIVMEVECHDGARIFVVTGRSVDGPDADRIARARRAVAEARSHTTRSGSGRSPSAETRKGMPGTIR